jgi:hypothetical protein
MLASKSAANKCEPVRRLTFEYTYDMSINSEYADIYIVEEFDIFLTFPPIKKNEIISLLVFIR